MPELAVLHGKRFQLQHHHQVIVDDPMFRKLVNLHTADMDVLDGEGLARRCGDASEDRAALGAAPPVVADDDIAARDELEGRLPRVGDCPHHALNRLPKRFAPQLCLPVGLVVGDLRVN
jgi:hypothetical protein